MKTTPHQSIQRYFIQASNGELYGTNALKGFTEQGAKAKTQVLQKLHPRRKFTTIEVQTFKELTNGLEDAY